MLKREDFNKESGLKGISGLSSDVWEIKAAAQLGNAQAQLALDAFIHHIRAGIGSMLMGLSRLNAIVFTGGIEENSAFIRAAACETCKFLGVEIDPHKNEESTTDRDIAKPNSQVRVYVIHTQENWAIAQDCWQLHQA